MGKPSDNSYSDTEDQKRRDELLLRLLKAPPQPRPKRDRGAKLTDRPVKRGDAAKREPSA